MLTAATVLAAGTGVVVILSGTKAASPAGQGPPTNTMEVQEGRLSATVSVAGTLSYQGGPDGLPYSVVNQARGTYTQLPGLGQVVSQGQVLYRVDDTPVVLLYGSTPVYRTLSIGSFGPDVAELNSDLVALGDATPAQLNPTSDSYGAATAAAVDKLEAALGVPQDSSLDLGLAVFEPTAVRLTALSVPLGGVAQAGQTLLTATSTTRAVLVALDASQQTHVAAGDTVTITLPNNQTTPGVVSSVGTVATCPATPAGSASGPAGPGQDTCSSTRSDNTTPTITVDVTPTDPAATGTWDQAPVRVSITTASVPSALAVPVTALLAQPGGGYAVEVVDARRRKDHLVPVTLGLFDDAAGLVQVTASGLSAGEDVVVPAT